MKLARHDSTIRINSIGPWLAMLGCAAWSADARGDGGTVRLARETIGYRITVFTAPTPIRAGLVDISVLVQDAETGNLLDMARVSIRMTQRTQPSHSIDIPATREAATNKLLQAANVTLPSPGGWDAVVAVEGPHGPAQVGFEVDVAEPLPQWRVLWPWFSWPAVVVLLFGVQQFLMHRHSRRNCSAIGQHDHVAVMNASGRD